jgi:D-glycero-D-manno-heptose 1,7-bisphosphate phosphatase
MHSQQTERLNRALFLDRDGVINEDTAYPYLPEQISFLPGIFDLCRAARRKGYLLIVVTNQAGVAKGHFSERDVEQLHRWMAERFADKGIRIAGFYYCPYHVDGVVEGYCVDSPLRKPKPGMLLKASSELHIDLARSLMVGDKPSDRIELPQLRCLILKSRYTGENYDLESLQDVMSYL